MALTPTAASARPDVIAPDASVAAHKAFSTSIVISAIRCTLTYVVLPFLAPVLGYTKGVGPALGIAIGVVAIIANVLSIARFWRASHPWRIPVTILNLGVMGLVAVLVIRDVAELIG